MTFHWGGPSSCIGEPFVRTDDIDIFFNYHNLLTVYQMADCPLCTGARGINKKEKFIEHLDSHQEMAMNHDMMFRKFKEYVLAHERFTE